jgi:hypothetical protein
MRLIRSIIFILIVLFLVSCSTVVAECVPITYTGNGDDVVNVENNKRIGCATITMTHDGARNFIVFPFNAQNEQLHSYANEIGPYSGIARWDGETDILEIDADGSWTISIK